VAVHTAQEAAERLAFFLSGLTQVHTINFIGHSLGCRVVLETIRALLLSGGQEERIGKVCLMAAAVPIFMLMEDARLDRAGFAPKRILNLFSRSDRVLQLAFPPGQTAAGPREEGVFPRALGRHGLVHPRITNKPIYKASHGHYWGHAGKDGSDEQSRAILANKHISELFGWARNQGRSIDSRQIAYERTTREFESGLAGKRIPAWSREIRERQGPV
jgi:pimeloyl-ACP methyl ester carboxylesterase